MDMNYIPLVTLRFLHDYFADGRLNGVKAMLTERSITLLKNYNLAWKQFGSEIVIAYDEQDSLSELRLQQLVEENGVIEIFLYTDHAFFTNFTDLPLTSPESNIYFFSNTTDVKAKTNEPVNLTREQTVSSADRYRLVQEVFQTNDEKYTGKIELLDIFNSKVQGAIAVREKAPATIDLRNEENGLYTIVSGKEKDTFYFDKSFGWSKPVAAIELWLGKDVPAMQRPVQNNGKVKPVVFEIAFKARPIFWKYYIMSQHLRELPALGIANGKSGITFTGPKEEILLEKHEALAFISETAIPLSDRRKHKFQLHKNYGVKDKQGKAVVSMLPQPGPEDIKPLKDNPNQYFSEIFIY
jgi:hypothetical protein